MNRPEPTHVQQSRNSLRVTAICLEMRLPEIMADARGEGFMDHEIKEALGDLSNTPLEQDDVTVVSADKRGRNSAGDM